MGLHMSNLTFFEFSRPSESKNKTCTNTRLLHPPSPRYNHKWTDLHYAASHGNVRRIQEIIHMAGTVNINKRDYYGKTPLYWAAYKGHLACVEELLKFGADMNTPCCHGETALVAVCSIHAQCALLLIKHGANVDLADYWGVTPMYIAACNGQTDIIRYLLEAGAKLTFRKKKSGEIPKELLEHKEFCDRLIKISENPKSLQHMCRSVVRKQLGVNPIVKVKSLNIPKKLQNYIALTQLV